MDEQITEWVRIGALEEWSKVKKDGDPDIPVVISPLGIEPSKPRALWDGRYVNEFCRDIPFSMDNATTVAEIAWEGVYFFKIDHKNGYNPMLDWIHDMLGMTQQQFSKASDEEQFQSALRAMVCTSYVLFKAGYFLFLSKCFSYS